MSKLIVTMVVVLLLPSCGPGIAPLWSQANPVTEIKVDPLSRTMSVYNSKDVSIKVEEFGGKSKDGAEFHVKGLELIDNASGPRLANVQQLEAVATVTAEIMKPIDNFLQVIAAKIPGGSVTPPTTTGPTP